VPPWLPSTPSYDLQALDTLAFSPKVTQSSNDRAVGNRADSCGDQKYPPKTKTYSHQNAGSIWVSLKVKQTCSEKNDKWGDSQCLYGSPLNFYIKIFWQ
jgi:hypothetical protein